MIASSKLELQNKKDSVQAELNAANIELAIMQARLRELESGQAAYSYTSEGMELYMTIEATDRAIDKFNAQIADLDVQINEGRKNG